MRKFFLIGLMVSVSALPACTPVVATHGNMLEDYQLKEILAGVDGKDDVVRKIGSPTTMAAFDENTWYYMGQKTKKQGILDPKLVNEKIIMVKFDLDGKVGSVTERKEGREDLPIIQRKTAVSGNEYTFIQQMLGNIGKYNAPKGSATETAGGNN